MCRGVKNMYHVLLSSEDPNFTEMRLQALQNLEEFLKSEELKLIKGDQNFGKGKEQENLKEMDQAGSGLGSTVIQIYWQAVLQGYFSNNNAIRCHSAQVANLTYTQGLVTPGTSIATLIAMTTDPLPIVRNRSTATQGVRKAYQLQLQIRGSSPETEHHAIRGIRACDVSPYATTSARVDSSTGLPRHSNDGQAVLSGLYQRLRTNRQQRRSFLTSVLRLFSEDSREKLRLEEWIFVADNIAMFPYQCKALLRPRQAYYSPQQQQQPKNQAEDDDLLFEPEILYTRIDSSTGLPRHSNDGQAVLSGLYQRLRTNRQQRRSFLTSVLRLFSEDSREKLRLEEWIFVADNIAMFPYQVMDEPLYVIHTIDSIVALSGQSLLVQCKALLRPRQAYYSPQQQQQPKNQAEDDDLLFEPEILYNRFPEEKGPLYDLMDNSQACFILLYLKNFLMKLYGFTEAKVQEYSPSEAAKVYEKTLSSRKNVPMFNPLAALDGGRRRDGAANDPLANDRQSIQSHFNLATKICSFRKLLLSLDRVDNDDDSDPEGDVAIAAKEQDDEEDADGCVEPSGESAEVDS
ncbi:hypothetical protein OESDEN_10065 [Oesophagostomum dentatum]|uniref:Nipped-B protein n=1 Tax=Oesophagostomum dentatum TaxID=61180 RepID=A0A0B1SYQ9_OESDE|nr:hypothetical protein OESDEN_10065 [Oesophagostomum dentatum]